MSIALMTMARKTALPTNLKFALMALADWADDNGANCYPSVYELSEYLTCSERTVQRLLRDLEDGKWIAVIGYANGGGSSRRYCLNVPRMEAEAKSESERRELEKERRRRDRKGTDSNPFIGGCQSVTPDKLSPVTSTTEGVTTAAEGVTNDALRGDTAVTPSTIDPPIDPPVNHHVRPAAPAAAKVKAEPVDEKETALQVACRATWAAYSEAYERRYGAKPVRNQSVNAKVKQFVLRIGHDESPLVAAFYVDKVSDSFVVRKVHDVGLLLSGAEGYRTQWAAGAAMTGTRAKQIDQSQSNYDAAGEALAILRQRRAEAAAC